MLARDSHFSYLKERVLFSRCIMSSCRHYLSALVVIIAVAVHIYYIFLASLSLPPSHRSDLLHECIASAKGGKRPGPCILGETCMGHRDCSLKRGGVCTKASPCTPCADYPLFPDVGCELCSITPTMGDCGFVEGYG